MPTTDKRWLRHISLGALVLSTSYVIASQAFHSQWHQDFLVQQLCTSSSRREYAAEMLASLGAEAKLLEAMRHSRPEVREAARRALDARWFQAAGIKAAGQILAAETASTKDQHEEALAILNTLVKEHPSFAEAWNRRGAVLWRMGRIGACLQSCERAVELNPEHYGAWLGLALCHIKLGDSAEATRCLKSYLTLQPFDDVAADSLSKCDRLAQLEEREYEMSVAGREAATRHRSSE